MTMALPVNASYLMAANQSRSRLLNLESFVPLSNNESDGGPALMELFMADKSFNSHFRNSFPRIWLHSIALERWRWSLQTKTIQSSILSSKLWSERSAWNPRQTLPFRLSHSVSVHEECVYRVQINNESIRKMERFRFGAEERIVEDRRGRGENENRSPAWFWSKYLVCRLYLFSNALLSLHRLLGAVVKIVVRNPMHSVERWYSSPF